MGYLTVWKVLEEIIIDLRKRGVQVPSKIIEDLRFLKTLINILKADPTRLETGEKIEEYINNIEGYLIVEGQRFGEDYIESWLKRLEEASRTMPEEEELRFIPGLPREQRWIRIKPSEDMPSELLKNLAGELNLSFETQNNGFLLIYGEDEKLKRFVKKMATKYGFKPEK
ncbi:MAG: DUF2096 family protein [Candidatus Bathyarchaeia archaeon]